jgi:uncharacterized membrane protein YkvA (DUF1232 family)
VTLWILLGYQTLPIDLIPDLIPALGYTDDAVVVTLVLRSVTRQAGPAALDRDTAGPGRGLRIA